MDRKKDAGDDAVFAMKVVTKLLTGSASDYRRRQVGWLPFLAF